MHNRPRPLTSEIYSRAKTMTDGRMRMKFPEDAAGLREQARLLFENRSKRQRWVKRELKRAHPYAWASLFDLALTTEKQRTGWRDSRGNRYRIPSPEWAQPCPKCGAEIDQQCRQPSGHTAPATHKARLKVLADAA